MSESPCRQSFCLHPLQPKAGVMSVRTTNRGSYLATVLAVGLVLLQILLRVLQVLLRLVLLLLLLLLY